VSSLPREAREGLVRAWLAILSARHPNVTWVIKNAQSTLNTTSTTGVTA
jgi:hypothetical protein